MDGNLLILFNKLSCPHVSSASQNAIYNVSVKSLRICVPYDISHTNRLNKLHTDFPLSPANPRVYNSILPK